MHGEAENMKIWMEDCIENIQIPQIAFLILYGLQQKTRDSRARTEMDLVIAGLSGLSGVPVFKTGNYRELHMLKLVSKRGRLWKLIE